MRGGNPLHSKLGKQTLFFHPSDKCRLLQQRHAGASKMSGAGWLPHRRQAELTQRTAAITAPPPPLASAAPPDALDAPTMQEIEADIGALVAAGAVQGAPDDQRLAALKKGAMDVSGKIPLPFSSALACKYGHGDVRESGGRGSGQLIMRDADGLRSAALLELLRRSVREIPAQQTWLLAFDGTIKLYAPGGEEATSAAAVELSERIADDLRSLPLLEKLLQRVTPQMVKDAGTDSSMAWLYLHTTLPVTAPQPDAPLSWYAGQQQQRATPTTLVKGRVLAEAADLPYLVKTLHDFEARRYVGYDRVMAAVHSADAEVARAALYELCGPADCTTRSAVFALQAIDAMQALIWAPLPPAVVGEFLAQEMSMPGAKEMHIDAQEALLVLLIQHYDAPPSSTGGEAGGMAMASPEVDAGVVGGAVAAADSAASLKAAPQDEESDRPKKKGRTSMNMRMYMRALARAFSVTTIEGSPTIAAAAVRVEARPGDHPTATRLVLRAAHEYDGSTSEWCRSVVRAYVLPIGPSGHVSADEEDSATRFYARSIYRFLLGLAHGVEMCASSGAPAPGYWPPYPAWANGRALPHSNPLMAYRAAAPLHAALQALRRSEGLEAMQRAALDVLREEYDRGGADEGWQPTPRLDVKNEPLDEVAQQFSENCIANWARRSHDRRWLVNQYEQAAQ